MKHRRNGRAKDMEKKRKEREVNSKGENEEKEEGKER